MLLLPSLLLLVVDVLCDAPASLDANETFQRQRQCAFPCFGYSVVGDPLDVLATRISCPTGPVQNDCFCRPDLQQDANRHISSCINARCSKNALDISVATKLYDDYCTSNGYTGEAQVKATSTAGALTITITAAPTTTIERTVIITQTMLATSLSGSEHRTRLTTGWTYSVSPIVVVLAALFGALLFAGLC